MMTTDDQGDRRRDAGIGRDPHGIEVLAPAECRRRLEQAAVARVGITADAMPVIVPVNVVVATLDPERGPEIVIRTVEGTKLDAALRNAVVAVEIDDVDPVTHGGWSVLVRGRSRAIEDPVEVERARELRLRPWASDDADRFIAIDLGLVSGRQVVPWHRDDE